MTIDADNIYNCDCIKGMREMPDNSVDLIVTDPPYDFMTKHKSTNYAGAGAFGKLVRSYHGELESAGIIDGFERDTWVAEVRRVMKRINIYIWCNKDQIYWYLNAFSDCNMELLTWHKKNPIPTCDNKYLSDTEYLLFFREKGVRIFGTYETKKKYWIQEINSADKDVWHHPTIKPLNIIQTLIVNSSEWGGVILDPFIGSGTTAVACIKEKRHFIGFELNPNYFKIAKQRVDAEQRQLKLF